jgi:hypothetical protein
VELRRRQTLFWLHGHVQDTGCRFFGSHDEYLLAPMQRMEGIAVRMDFFSLVVCRKSVAQLEQRKVQLRKPYPKADQLRDGLPFLPAIVATLKSVSADDICRPAWEPLPLHLIPRSELGTRRRN